MTHTAFSHLAPHSPKRLNLLVWRRPLRALHWSLAITVVCTLFVAAPGSSAHALAGRTVLALVILRLGFAVFGRGYAHCVSYTLSGIGAQLADLWRGAPHVYLGHSPLSSLFALSFWSALLVTACSGLALGDVGTGQAIAILHSGAASLVFGLTLLHLVTLIRRWLRRSRGPVTCMFTGRQSIPEEIDIRA